MLRTSSPLKLGKTSNNQLREEEEEEEEAIKRGDSGIFQSKREGLRGCYETL